MIRQLAFDLPSRVALGREDFFVSPSNALAVAAVGSWRDWPGARMLLLGAAGSGKTHLAHVWEAEAGARIIAADALTRCDPNELAEGPLAVEDADRIAGDSAAETTLFHLMNLTLAQRQPLLLTAEHAPRDWGLCLPDLLSRAQAFPVARLEPPDDALLAAVLVKLFSDRQITVAPTLIPYLVSRMDRSFAAAHDLVAALDARSLAEGRPITRQLAAPLLDSEGSAQ
ncbi:DnaA/Hda family protein [Tabrizicola sp. J26]|uniref:DnaA/Hda family protein n=1 Tax=Alitabrizicola rongguiensis TaxID=2909234 RepID=UPI001F1A223E|nr:DnaA/Hda family protein [Tabrizicola rongguiensis]MCF1708864.1 DnaA/Hda family protein [Tabrizicola rongguiensis]